MEPTKTDKPITASCKVQLTRETTTHTAAFGLVKSMTNLTLLMIFHLYFREFQTYPVPVFYSK